MSDAIPYTVLTVNQMYDADRITINTGTSSFQLMCNAADAIVTRIRPTLRKNDNVLVVCGAGNNGGDGLVVAEQLQQLDVATNVLLIGKASALSGDAKLALQSLSFHPLSWSSQSLQEYTVVIDALLGAGLSRELSGEMEALVQTINQNRCHKRMRVISIDLPSGINGDTGEVCGTAIDADETITFFKKKPGHLLYPGRAHCGEVSVVSIGIQDYVIDTDPPTLIENHPAWWRRQCPRPQADAHKYSRGHAVVISGGPYATGAARMTAEAALRTGAGLVTLCSQHDAMPINAMHLTAIMLKQIDTTEQLNQYLGDSRITSVTLGPGLGVGEYTRQLVRVALTTSKAVVLDADALTSFENQSDVLFDLVKRSSGNVVLTPHAGEFRRLFGADQSSTNKDKVALAREAAQLSGAVVVYKGPDTVIAHPTGNAVINSNAPPWLATAGSGDVLAGTIAGWLAQDVDPFYATCAACWIHGEAAANFGPGLIATDIVSNYPNILKQLFS